MFVIVYCTKCEEFFLLRAVCQQRDNCQSKNSHVTAKLIRISSFHWDIVSPRKVTHPVGLLIIIGTHGLTLELVGFFIKSYSLQDFLSFLKVVENHTFYSFPWLECATNVLRIEGSTYMSKPKSSKSILTHLKLFSNYICFNILILFWIFSLYWWRKV